MENSHLLRELGHKGITRREFLKFCGVMAVTLALPHTFGTRIAEALQAPQRTPVADPAQPREVLRTIHSLDPCPGSFQPGACGREMWTVGDTFSDAAHKFSAHVDAATATGFGITIETGR